MINWEKHNDYLFIGFVDGVIKYNINISFSSTLKPKDDTFEIIRYDEIIYIEKNPTLRDYGDIINVLKEKINSIERKEKIKNLLYG